MAFEADEFGRSIAAPGLVFPDQPYTCETRVMAEEVDSEGGFPIFGKIGEDVKAYAQNPASNGYFLGIAQRIVTRDSYPAGVALSVVTAGRIWVKVAADVSSGNHAFITAEGKFGAAGTELANATYKTSAKNGGYAVVELK